MRYEYKTQNVCSQRISFDIDGDVITNISFLGGCNGNLKAISKLLEGQTVSYIEEKLRGNICGMKSTSCADQLAIAVRKAYDENKG
ncbi:MAG: TIGR03905 family TSCPD domain-containing protein [Oscillospiraceae bacterium]|nr:TIGR03905 family TSCPD domain-containing protein [Oscillospiraceae bacterium]